MCKDGKCQERAGQTRNVVISLGTAARAVAQLTNHPHMVVKAPTHIAFVIANPELFAMPGFTVMMEVYPTSDDAEIAWKADDYLDGVRRNSQPPPRLIRLLEQLLGLPSTSDVSDGSTGEVPQLAPRANA